MVKTTILPCLSFTRSTNNLIEFWLFHVWKKAVYIDSVVNVGLGKQLNLYKRGYKL